MSSLPFGVRFLWFGVPWRWPPLEHINFNKDCAESMLAVTVADCRCVHIGAGPRLSGDTTIWLILAAYPPKRGRYQERVFQPY